MKWFNMLKFSDNDMKAGISSGVSVVDFYADWCSPCRMLGVILDRTSKVYKNARFAKLDVESNPKITSEFSIASLPTVIIFKDGKIVEKITGLVSEANLLKAVDKAVSSVPVDAVG